MKTLVVTLVVALEVDAVSWQPARGDEAGMEVGKQWH
jgi:hypothetical protein